MSVNSLIGSSLAAFIIRIRSHPSEARIIATKMFPKISFSKVGRPLILSKLTLLYSRPIYS